MNRRGLLTGTAAIAAYATLNPARASMSVFEPAIGGGDNLFPPPIGTPPGFNPAHVAARGVQLSAVAFNGQMATLNNYLVPTVTGTLAGVVDPYLGYVQSAAANAQSKFTVRGAGTADPSTIAFICMRTAGAANITFGGWQTGVPGSAWELFWISASGNFGVFNGTSTQDSTIPMTINVPYFIVLSSLLAGNAQWTALNLKTGQVRQTSTVGGAPIADAGAFRVGASGGFRVATAMASSVGMRAAQQLAWAQDPWNFWYPNRTNPVDNIVGATPAPAGSGLNRALLGVGQ